MLFITSSLPYAIGPSVLRIFGRRCPSVTNLCSNSCSPRLEPLSCRYSVTSCTDQPATLRWLLPQGRLWPVLLQQQPVCRGLSSLTYHRTQPPLGADRYTAEDRVLRVLDAGYSQQVVRLVGNINTNQEQKLHLDEKVLSNLKYDKNQVIFTHNYRTHCVVYNFVGVVMCGIIGYLSYYVYTKADLETELPTPEKPIVPVSKQMYLDKHRLLLAGCICSLGVAYLLFTLRYTMRCVQSLVLLRDGKSVAITTLNFLGTRVCRTLPLEQVYAANVEDFISGFFPCPLYVEGTRVHYHLDFRGVLHLPQLLRVPLAVKKPFMDEKQDETTDSGYR